MLATGQAQVARTVHGPWQSVRRHDHGWACLNLITAGVYVEISEGQATVALPGQVVVKAPGAHHGNAFGPLAASSVRVELHPSLAGWIRAEAPTVRPISSGLWPLLDALRPTRRAGPPTRATAEALVEALAVEADEPSGDLALEAAAATVLARSMRVDIADLAGSLGIERTALAHRFRRRFGCSMRQYQVRRRVARAASRLVAGSMVAEAAQHAGFADQSHCCRAFRAVLGDAPRGWTRRVRAL